jgi:3-oxoacyl-[acyl-carrier protein] reductase
MLGRSSARELFAEKQVEEGPKSLFRLPHTGRRRVQKENMMGETVDINTTVTGASFLQGQVALITGASRGIGAATALLFAQHGAAVGVNYYNNSRQAQEVVEAIGTFGGRAIAVQASVDNAEEVGAMVQRVEQELGPIDTLVLNAIAGSKLVENSGKSTATRDPSIFTPFLDSTWEQYQNIVVRTLAGVYVPARAVVPLMVERKRGNLIAVSSTAARAPYISMGALAAGKASVEAFMKALVPELGPHSIRVNVVAPGAVETEASAPYIQMRKEGMSQNLPLRRLGQPEDIAGAILLLAAPLAGYLTGNYLAAGGGNYLP